MTKLNKKYEIYNEEAPALTPQAECLKYIKAELATLKKLENKARTDQNAARKFGKFCATQVERLEPLKQEPSKLARKVIYSRKTMITIALGLGGLAGGVGMYAKLKTNKLKRKGYVNATEVGKQIMGDFAKSTGLAVGISAASIRIGCTDKSVQSAALNYLQIVKSLANKYSNLNK